MSNMKITFWPSIASSDQINVDVLESSFTTGCLRSTFYMAATDAQRLMDAMIEAGMRPTGRICVKKGDLR